MAQMKIYTIAAEPNYGRCAIDIALPTSVRRVTSVQVLIDTYENDFNTGLVIATWSLSFASDTMPAMLAGSIYVPDYNLVKRRAHSPTNCNICCPGGRVTGFIKTTPQAPAQNATYKLIIIHD